MIPRVIPGRKNDRPLLWPVQRHRPADLGYPRRRGSGSNGPDEPGHDGSTRDNSSDDWKKSVIPPPAPAAPNLVRTDPETVAYRSPRAQFPEPKPCASTPDALVRPRGT